ncbi:oxidoreductase [Bisporella sp. PMI_857]|nr:oxidoreductase [Bisporella sp. PMI_857]
MAPFPSPTSKRHSRMHEPISPTRPELSAKGKTAAVTGGGSGSGAETARYFAEAGASRITLLGWREQLLLDTKASIERKYNDVDVFAGSTDVTKKSEDPVRDSDSDKFLEAIQQNLRGLLFVAQAFLRYASTDAVAINVSSSSAHLNYVPGFASYSIAKLAIIRLWDSAAFENPEISVFHVHPGVVDTAMNREAGGIGFIGYEDDISLPASFNVSLASPEACFLKGKYLWANWDVDELKARANEIEASTQLSIGFVGWPF